MKFANSIDCYTNAVSKAVASEQVVDLFAAAGLNNPDISILSDEFLEDVRGLPYRNLALEVLHKLINDEIKTRSRKNLVQSRSFASMLEIVLQQAELLCKDWVA